MRQNAQAAVAIYALGRGRADWLAISRSAFPNTVLSLVIRFSRHPWRRRPHLTSIQQSNSPSTPDNIVETTPYYENVLIVHQTTTGPTKMPRTRGTQIYDGTLKLDSLRAQQTVNSAIGKLWQYQDRRRRPARARRLSAFQAYFENYLQSQVDDDARSDLSPTPSPRASPPPMSQHVSTSQRRIHRRRQRAEEHQIWCLSERYGGQKNVQQNTGHIQKSRDNSQTSEEKQHQMVTRAHTTRRTRFYRLRLPT